MSNEGMINGLRHNLCNSLVAFIKFDGMLHFFLPPDVILPALPSFVRDQLLALSNRFDTDPPLRAAWENGDETDLLNCQQTTRKIALETTSRDGKARQKMVRASGLKADWGTCQLWVEARDRNQPTPTCEPVAVGQEMMACGRVSPLH